MRLNAELDYEASAAPSAEPLRATLGSGHVCSTWSYFFEWSLEEMCQGPYDVGDPFMAAPYKRPNLTAEG